MGTVGLDGGSVQGRLSVQQENVPILHVPAHLGTQKDGYMSACGNVCNITDPSKGLPHFTWVNSVGLVF